jgi:hypothetical protein
MSCACARSFELFWREHKSATSEGQGGRGTESGDCSWKFFRQRAGIEIWNAHRLVCVRMGKFDASVERWRDTVCVYVCVCVGVYA